MWILFSISLILSYLTVSYRENDWITGGLLFVAIILPALIGELALIAGFYMTNKEMVRSICLGATGFLTFGLLVFTLVYLFKYN